MKKIAVFEKKKEYIKILKKSFRKYNKNLVIIEKNEHQSIKNLLDVSAIVNIPRKVFDKNLLNNLKNLEWVHIGGAGIETFLFDEFINHKSILTNGKIIQGPSVSDHAIALLLAFSRNLNFHIKFKNLNKIQIERPIELRGKKCAIFGLGGIGHLIAEKLNVFGVKIFGFTDQYVNMSASYEKIYLYEKIHTEIKDMDILICAAPLTSETKKFFDLKFFKKMKKNSIFINVSRGGVVNQEVLNNKKLISKFRGFGLDVTDPEPLKKSHFLKNMNNVILTNHTAGPSDKNRERSFNLMMENLNRFLNKKNLLNVVNKTRGY